MKKFPVIVAIAVALSSSAVLAQTTTTPMSSSGVKGTTSDSSVGVTGTASDAAVNTPNNPHGGSTSTSMEEQRIKNHNGNTAPNNGVNR